MDKSGKPYCGNCDKTDGAIYTSAPPKVRCTVTGKYHWLGDICDCDMATQGETQGEQPRICEVLGGKENPLEVGEVFTIKGYPNRDYRYAVVHTDGKLHNYLEEPCQTTGTRVGNKIGVNALYWLLAHPEAIIRKPRFTQEEVADARAIRRMWPDGEVKFKRDMDGRCALIQIQGCCQGCLGLGKVDLFPSLRPGQAVALSDICGC